MLQTFSLALPCIHHISKSVWRLFHSIKTTIFRKAVMLAKVDQLFKCALEAGPYQTHSRPNTIRDSII